MKVTHRFDGTSAGGLLRSSRASASAQTRGAPPSYSAMAARSSSASAQAPGDDSQFRSSRSLSPKVSKAPKVRGSTSATGMALGALDGLDGSGAWKSRLGSSLNF